MSLVVEINEYTRYHMTGLSRRVSTGMWCYPFQYN